MLSTWNLVHKKKDILVLFWGAGVGSRKTRGFLGGSVVKNLLANAGDVGSIPGLGRSPREGNGNTIDGSPPGSPVLGILQAKTLEWVAISFSNA